MFKVGDKVKLCEKMFGKDTSDKYGTMVVQRVEEQNARTTVVFVHGGLRNIPKEENFNLQQNCYRLVQSKNKITINTRKLY